MSVWLLLLLNCGVVLMCVGVTDVECCDWCDGVLWLVMLCVVFDMYV